MNTQTLASTRNMANMPAYNPDSVCPKCGEETSITEYDICYRVKPDGTAIRYPIFGISPREGPGIMWRICDRCGHERAERPLDWKAP